MTINCTPNWANSSANSSNCNSLVPTNLTNWSNFVTAFINRYSSYDVTLGVYNEPNIAEGGNMSYSTYCSLFQSAASARGSSSMALAGPETSWHGIGTSYFANVMNCMRSSMAPQDKVTHHYYADATTSLNTTLATANFYADGLEVWLSEVGIDTTNTSTQAAYVQSFIDSFDDLALSYPNWTAVIWYRLWSGSGSDPHFKFALLNGDYSEKPAFGAYENLITELSGEGAGAMSPNESLAANQGVDSEAGTFHFIYQNDGNLVLYDASYFPYWDSQTANSSTNEAVMQSDGNFVVYDANSNPIWYSGTNSNNNAYLVVQNDGDLRIYSSAGRPIYNFSY